MDFLYALGIDIAKLTFDYALMDQQGEVLLQGQVQNEQDAISEWIESMEVSWSDVIICLEHSGFYNAGLLKLLHQKTVAKICLESPLQIKRSGGLQRGKDDSLDALRIAAYALDFQRKASFWSPRPEQLDRLALLISHRDRMVKNLMSIQNTLKEQENFVNPTQHLELLDISQNAIDAIQLAIQTFNQKIESLLKEDTLLARQTEIITSIPGFGQVIASKLLLITQGFTRINTPRKLACFAGVAPFPNRSGTSLRGRTKVSPFANKEIKKMLHLAALVTIRKNNIMYEYFQRKVAEGKNKMSVINAVRNKLIHILMACIKNNTIYQKIINIQLLRT